MFGKKTPSDRPGNPSFQPESQPAPTKRIALVEPVQIPDTPRIESDRPAAYYDLKKDVVAALIEAINVAHLSVMELAEARSEVRSIVADILTARKSVMSSVEQE